MGANLFDSGVETKFQRVFSVNVPRDLALKTLIEELCLRVPELKLKWFNIKENKGTATYWRGTKHMIGGHKVVLDRLQIDRISPTQIQLNVHYIRPFFRPFLFIFSMIGLLFGLLPGLLIWFIFREPEADQVKNVRPALSRFQELVTGTPFGATETPSEKNSSITIVPPPEPVVSTTSIEDRLNRLRDFRSQNAISENEYQEQRKRILAEL